jgi:hypothetical protein
MDVLELPEIPRERGKLQATINEWKHTRKMRRLSRWVSLNLAFWMLYTALFWAPWYIDAKHAMQRAQSAPIVQASIVVPVEPAQEAAQPAPQVQPTQPAAQPATGAQQPAQAAQQEQTTVYHSYLPIVKR